MTADFRQCAISDIIPTVPVTVPNEAGQGKDHKPRGDILPPASGFCSCGAVFFFHSCLACSINASLRLYSRSISAALAWELMVDWW